MKDKHLPSCSPPPILSASPINDAHLSYVILYITFPLYIPLKPSKYFPLILWNYFKARANISAYNGSNLETELTTDCASASSDWREQ